MKRISELNQHKQWKGKKKLESTFWVNERRFWANNWFWQVMYSISFAKIYFSREIYWASVSISFISFWSWLSLWTKFNGVPSSFDNEKLNYSFFVWILGFHEILLFFLKKNEKVRSQMNLLQNSELRFE